MDTFWQGQKPALYRLNPMNLRYLAVLYLDLFVFLAETDTA
jgi:hypothetical protein